MRFLIFQVTCWDLLDHTDIALFLQVLYVSNNNKNSIRFKGY